jgi:hypothetical protein
MKSEASAGYMTAEEEAQERASILQHLDALELLWREGEITQDEAKVVVGQIRLRVIAFARARGGAAFARMMRPFDDHVGDNVVRLRRRGR